MPASELERIEHLCRYVTRPPIATQRLALAPDGRVIYGLKRHWRDSTSAVSFDPLTFIERLAAESSSQRLQGVVEIRRCATNRGLPSTAARPSTHLSRRARAGPRLARPHRAQARARIHFAYLRPARSQLADRAEHLRPLALVALAAGPSSCAASSPSTSSPARTAVARAA
ncbi:MAG: transposase [Planctomycetes bacterium]|nr:transposase [Planctomycetota bacterium]